MKLRLTMIQLPGFRTTFECIIFPIYLAGDSEFYAISPKHSFLLQHHRSFFYPALASTEQFLQQRFKVAGLGQKSFVRRRRLHF